MGSDGCGLVGKRRGGRDGMGWIGEVVEHIADDGVREKREGKVCKRGEE